jgi:hypothetical protein
MAASVPMGSLAGQRHRAWIDRLDAVEHAGARPGPPPLTGVLKARAKPLKSRAREPTLAV